MRTHLNSLPLLCSLETGHWGTGRLWDSLLVPSVTSSHNTEISAFYRDTKEASWVRWGLGGTLQGRWAQHRWSGDGGKGRWAGKWQWGARTGKGSEPGPRQRVGNGVIIVQPLSCPTLCNPHGLQHARLPCPALSPREISHTQTHVHQVGDTIQPSHPLSLGWCKL